MDESGFMLQPLVRRTWAPLGETPILRAWDRHDRLSVIDAITLAPLRRRIGLYWQVHPANIRGPHVVGFLRHLRRRIRRKIVLIWDRGTCHKGRPVRDYLERHARTIRVEWLPPYAPQLNPGEQVWNHAKYSDLANFVARDTPDLHAHVDASLRDQRTQSRLLRSFFRTAKLRL
jgi:transposase